MSLTLAAIIIMGGWVVLIVAAGLVMSLRPGGVAVRFAPAGAPVGLTGPRDEILLGGDAEVLGNVRGRVQAVQLGPANRRLQDLELATGLGFEERQVPADAILSADGRLVRLTDHWTDSADGSRPEAATLRRDMAVRSVDGKRLGRLRLVCFDSSTDTVTALVVAGPGEPSLRSLPIDRVKEAGPKGIITDVRRDEWTKLPPFATDWDIKQAFYAQLLGDRALQSLERSISIEVHDQVVTVRGYVADRSQADQVARLISSVPGVTRVDTELITDADLEKAVSEAIRRVPGTSAAKVQVHVHDGTVDITGAAPDRATAQRIESAASRVAGVQVVHNMVTIRTAA
jgi:osmotically-inducible protein OsmY